MIAIYSIVLWMCPVLVGYTVGIAHATHAMTPRLPRLPVARIANGNAASVRRELDRMAQPWR